MTREVKLVFYVIDLPYVWSFLYADMMGTELGVDVELWGLYKCKNWIHFKTF